MVIKDPNLASLARQEQDEKLADHAVLLTDRPCKEFAIEKAMERINFASQ